MPRAFLLSILIFFCPLRAWPMGGAIPSGYPSTFMMGYVNEAHVDAAGRYVAAGSEFNTIDHYMAPIGSGWAATYKYLIGGTRADNGANCWWNAYPGNGLMPGAFMDKADSHSYMPVFIYENMQGFTGNYPSGIKSAFDSSAFMGKYFSDWADLMIKVDAWLTGHPGKIVSIDVEPDVWGYMQQNYSSDPSAISAMVAGAANPGGSYPWTNLSSFPNTVQGAARALLFIKDSRLASGNRANLKLAFHVSSWAVAPNPATQQGPVNIASHAASVAGFMNACKSIIAGGANWDLLFLDPADGDAGLYASNGLDSGGSTHWWDAGNVTEPTFNRYRDWVDALSSSTNLRCMLWQVPIGNQVYKTMNNTAGHYQDNRAEYFLNAANGTANVCDWAAHGVIGILWGRGSIIPVGAGYTVGTGGPDYWYTTWGTDYSGGTQDNVTNPGAGTTSTIADDDGGYLRSRMPAYFSSPCNLPGVGTPTNSPTPSPNWSPTPSPTVTLTPQCPGGMLADLASSSQTNNWGGWIGGNPGSGSATFAIASPGNSGGYRARLTGNNVSAGPSSISSSFNAGATAANISGFGGVRFWFKGNAGQYRMNIHTNNGSWDDWGYVFNMAAADTWTYLQIPYGMLAQVGWGPAAWTPSGALSINFFPTVTGAYDFSVDNIEFYCPPPTPTSTVSPSATVTATRTPSPSATSTRTVSPSQTPSGTSTISGTVSPTLSSTATATTTGTFTRTQTQSAFTPSITPTLSSTRTSTVSATPSSSVSPTVSSTAPTIVTATGTATASATLSASPTSTSVITPSASGTATNTPLPGATKTDTATVSPSMTGTATSSGTPTPSLTLGPSNTLTATQTATAISVATNSMTLTSIVASTATATATPTGTQTAVTATVATASPSPASTQTSISPSLGPNDIIEAEPVPQPNPKWMLVKMAGACDRIQIGFYSRAMVSLVKVDGPGAQGPGWVKVPLPPEIQQAENGSYHYSIQSFRVGQGSLKTKKGTLVVLR